MNHPVPGADQGPILRVRVGEQVREFVDGPVVAGRDSSQQIVLPSSDVSRRQLEFRRSGPQWWVADLESTNGSFIDGRPVGQQPLPADRPVLILAGGAGGVTLEVTAVSPAAPPSTSARTSPAAGSPAVSGAFSLPPGQLQHGQTILPGSPRQGAALSLGRTRSNDVVLDDALVSRHHATLIPGPGATATLRDLNSFNGTFVNGARIAGAVTLQVGDEVLIGTRTFTWDGSNLAAKATRRDLTLFVENLTCEVKGGKRLLDNVSFELQPSSLTAVIGPSGAGKSTLLNAVTGLRPATHGHVVWQGHDLYTHYEQLRFQIGLVPQQDIQHPQLTVRQGLDYAARLRLPPDTERTERQGRVDQVVGQMQLDRQIDQRIGTQLSGGQKKRVSIATELLTAPPLLFLDEPTSGLDPGLDRDVMHQLRGLADDGRVVMVVTHSVLALDVCDNVLVLAPGGRVAYFGPPSGVQAHFGVADWPQVFDVLDDPDLLRRFPVQTDNGPTGSRAVPNGPVAPPPIQSRMRQFTTLVRRNLAVTAADRLLLAMLVAMPLVLGALSRVVQGDAGLSILDTGSERTINGVTRTIYDSGEIMQRLVILVTAASLMGAAMTVRELVKERAVFRREYAVGLSPGMYLASKVAVLGTACLLQGILLTFVATVGMPGPDGGGVLGLGRLEVALAMGAVAATMAILGLGISAVVGSSEQTMPALVALVMVQLILSGALVEVRGRLLLEQIAWLAPSRWGFGAAAASVDYNRPRRVIPGLVPDRMFTSTVGTYLVDLVMVGALAGLALGIAYLLVRRSADAHR